jgi:hypothetical protein
MARPRCFDPSKLNRHSRICTQSGKLHRKSRALVVIASVNSQFTADPFDKRSNYPHSHPRAGGWVNPSGKLGPSLESPPESGIRYPDIRKLLKLQKLQELH